jgi:hypothetical protein
MGLHVKRSRMEEMDCVLQERKGGRHGRIWEGRPWEEMGRRQAWEERGAGLCERRDRGEPWEERSRSAR